MRFRSSAGESTWLFACFPPASFEPRWTLAIESRRFWWFASPPAGAVAGERQIRLAPGAEELVLASIALAWLAFALARRWRRGTSRSARVEADGTMSCALVVIAISLAGGAVLVRAIAPVVKGALPAPDPLLTEATTHAPRPPRNDFWGEPCRSRKDCGGDVCAFELPGCGDAAVGHCGAFGYPQCDHPDQYCACTGQTLSRCGRPFVPWSSQGECSNSAPAASGGTTPHETEPLRAP